MTGTRHRMICLVFAQCEDPTCVFLFVFKQILLYKSIKGHSVCDFSIEVHVFAMHKSFKNKLNILEASATMSCTMRFLNIADLLWCGLKSFCLQLHLNFTSNEVLYSVNFLCSYLLMFSYVTTGSLFDLQ